jgi:hypothetical protein
MSSNGCSDLADEYPAGAYPDSLWGCVTDWTALTSYADYHWDCTRSYLISLPIIAHFLSYVVIR